MFVDKVAIMVKAGRGGNGISHFHREKFVPLGGPDGGDGGRGGHVILVADQSLKTLVDFSYRREFAAASGHAGSGNRKAGKKAADCRLRVPMGTLVLTAGGELLADLNAGGQQFIAAKGGRGGRGNVHFATALRRAPRLAEKGEPGEEKELILELKLLADVGLVGLPNAGKSTLLSAVSAARPKIADYPFTTLAPNLGVVRIGEGASFVMVDIPGLIAGAAQGSGLGHEFLRHVERTRLLIHLVDIGFPGAQPDEAFATVNRELRLYDARLLQRPQLVALNKTDLVSDPAVLKKWVAAFRRGGHKVFTVSAATRQGVMELAQRAYALLGTLPPGPAINPAARRIITGPPPRFALKKISSGCWKVTGKEVEKWVAMTDFDNEEAVAKLKDILGRIGLSEEFKRQAVEAGDTIIVGKEEFFFQEDF
ncbi:GTPase ObgE [candidate division FCPU426 bacterium]|nr:GTPase ObgE [candidate division FCPU426 bacterium]